MNEMVSARRAGVPLVLLTTLDPTAAIKAAISDLAVVDKDYPILHWDLVRGVTAINEEAAPVVDGMAGGQEVSLATARPDEFLKMLTNGLPKNGVCFMLGAHKILKDDVIGQSVWNLRDEFKNSGRMLVLVAMTGTRAPDDLKDDIVLIEHLPPNDEELTGIIGDLCTDAGVPVPEKVEDVVDPLAGVSAFSAEQTLSMSITKQGIQMPMLYKRIKRSIEGTDGVSVFRGQTTPVIGYARLGYYLKLLLPQFKGVMFIDEIEKLTAGAGGDTSGVSQDQLAAFLSWSQDMDVPGVLLVGPGGTGKSQSCKYAASQSERPLFTADLGAAKGSLVGESEKKIRRLLSTVYAGCRGKPIMIATCNKEQALPPEVKRRFRLGTFFMDLPNAEERSGIWDFYTKRVGITGDLPDDANWTGAEISACCDVAKRTGLSLVDAAGFIVPIYRSAKEDIDALRKRASGRFLSASYEGVYRVPEGAVTEGRRTIKV